MQGTVKWFNEEKGFGFIKPDEGSKDLFVHVSALRGIRGNQMQDGTRVSFDIESGKKGLQASNVSAA